MGWWAHAGGMHQPSLRRWEDSVTGSPPGPPRNERRRDRASLFCGSPRLKSARGSRQRDRKDAEASPAWGQELEEPAEYRGKHGFHGWAELAPSPHFITYEFSGLVSQLPDK